MQKLRFKEILSDKKVTGKDLAEKVGLTETSISRIINGSQLPKLETLFKIADALDVNIREFFGGSADVVPIYKKEGNNFVEIGEVNLTKAT